MADELFNRLLEFRNASFACDAHASELVKRYSNPPLGEYKANDWERRCPGPKAEVRAWHPEGLRQCIEWLDDALSRWAKEAADGTPDLITSVLGMQSKPVYVNGFSYPLAHQGAEAACRAVRDILWSALCEHTTAMAAAATISKELQPFVDRVCLYGQIEAEFWEAVKHCDKESPNGNPAQKSQPDDPAEGDVWQFLPGQAIYKGTVISVKGIHWKLLKALVEHKARSEQELIDAGWGHDADKEPKTLQNALSILRRNLQNTLGMLDKDPIPVVDIGENRAWKIDDSLR